MPLPKIVTPEFSTHLPSTGEEIFFRPFLVKEEKILLMAQEGKDPKEIQKAIVHILTECIKTPVVVEELALFDVEWLFLQLRAKSVSEVIDVKLNHIEKEDCGHSNAVLIPIKDIQMTRNKDHKDVIILDEATGIGVQMKYPSLDLYNILDLSNQSYEQVFEVIVQSVLSVFDKDQVYNDFTKPEIEKFIEDLDQKHLKKFMDFFDTMPKLEHEIKYKCEKCGEEVTTKLSGLLDFFT